jgi:hypothetical protein
MAIWRQFASIRDLLARSRPLFLESNPCRSRRAGGRGSRGRRCGAAVAPVEATKTVLQKFWSGHEPRGMDGLAPAYAWQAKIGQALPGVAWICLVPRWPPRCGHRACVTDVREIAGHHARSLVETPNR